MAWFSHWMVTHGAQRARAGSLRRQGAPVTWPGRGGCSLPGTVCEAGVMGYGEAMLAEREPQRDLRG